MVDCGPQLDGPNVSISQDRPFVLAASAAAIDPPLFSGYLLLLWHINSRDQIADPIMYVRLLMGRDGLYRRANMLASRVHRDTVPVASRAGRASSGSPERRRKRKADHQS